MKKIKVLFGLVGIAIILTIMVVSKGETTIKTAFAEDYLTGYMPRTGNGMKLPMRDATDMFCDEKFKDFHLDPVYPCPPYAE